MDRLKVRLVGESALDAGIAHRFILIDDAHRDAAGRADRRAVVAVAERPVLVHAATLTCECVALAGHCADRD